MIKHFYTWLLLLILICQQHLHAQLISRYNTFNYNVNEGLLQSHADDIAFDKNNFAWLSFANGIQKFDGHSFIPVPVQPGLPDDKAAGLVTTSKGDLLILHSQGISKYEPQNNKLKLIYHNDPSLKEPVLFIGEDEQIVYFFAGEGTIIGININSYAVISVVKTGFIDYKTDPYKKLIVTGNIIDHCIGFYADSSLIIWNLAANKVIYRNKNKSVYTLFKIWLSNKHKILYFSNQKDNKLLQYDFISGKELLMNVYPGNDNKSPRAIFFSWQGKPHLSYFGRIYETDTNFSKPLRELRNFQNDPVTGDFVSNVVKQDLQGNLYLLTANNGIRKVISNNYPIRYYGGEKKGNNFIVSVCPDKKANRVLAGTQGNGVLVFDTLQRLIKQIPFLPGDKEGFTPVIIVRSNDGGYLLFCWGKKMVWKLSSDLSSLREIPVSTHRKNPIPVINYFSNLVFQNDSICLAHSQGLLYRINLKMNSIQVAYMPAEVTGCFFYHDRLVAHSNDEIIFIDTASMAITKKIPLKNTGGVRSFVAAGGGGFYIGSNKGIFKFDRHEQPEWQVNKETGLGDECIYAMITDAAGYVWCSTNKGIFKIDKNGSVLQLKKEDGLQENEFNTNVAAISADGEVFFGGVNGVSSFFPAAIRGFDETINLLFTRIKANNEDVIRDTAAWNISAISLPYERNSLSFDFLAMGNSNPEQYVYQYKLDGVDDQWIQNDGLQTVRYSLSPGQYTFKIYASRSFDKDALSMKEIKITIQPPFWKTWWFLTGLLLVFAGLLALTINRINKNKYEKKLQVLESERKIKLERERISRDLHDSLGAYANAVLYNTELLEQEKNNDKKGELMKDLKFASRDIITALRETVWALNKENYTAEDCLLRIRNFIQPLSRYYNHIHFIIEGKAPAEKEFHYTKALNLVRTIQEAVSNCIKHAEAKTITVSSAELAGQWVIRVQDDGKGFDYEEIKKQEHGNGLGNMHQRAADGGFSFSIISNIGTGTTITVVS